LKTGPFGIAGSNPALSVLSSIKGCSGTCSSSQRFILKKKPISKKKKIGILNSN
jgi:hypothetical protein